MPMTSSSCYFFSFIEKIVEIKIHKIYFIKNRDIKWASADTAIPVLTGIAPQALARSTNTSQTIRNVNFVALVVMDIAQPVLLENIATVTGVISAFGAVRLQRDIARLVQIRFTKNKRNALQWLKLFTTYQAGLVF